MGRMKYGIFLVCGLFLLTACGAQQQSLERAGKQDSESSKTESGIWAEFEKAYEKDPQGIDLFCEVMKVEKDKITLFHNFTDNDGKNCFDIGVEGDPGKTGIYIIDQYIHEEDGREYRRIARKVPDKELDKCGIHLPSGNNDLSIYEFVYDGIWEEDMVGLNPVKPEIDGSGVKEYTETLFGTNPIWEAYSGYVNDQGTYSVSYVGDVSNGWRRGIFKDGKWKTWQMPALEDEGPDYYYFMGSDDRLWYYSYSSGTMLRLYDKKGKKIGEIDTSEWVKKNGMINKNTVEVTVVTDKKALFNFRDEEGKDKCFLVDVTTGELKKEYESSISGTCYGDYVYCYLGTGNDVLEIVNWKTGELSACLDLSGIRQEYSLGRNFIGYSKGMQCFYELSNDEIPGMGAGSEPIHFCVYGDTLYFSYFSGVYRYRPETNKLEKILDGNKQPKFQKMYGDFDVGEDESIYLLGFLGGGDDEGATDFLYLRRK